MQQNQNPLKSTRVEFHILQSFPVTCLNRDDVGAPKTAVVGGVPRARISSQCWKRAIRLAMRELGVKTACRTKLIEAKIEGACRNEGATEEQAKKCAQAIASVFIKAGKGKSKKGGEDEAQETESDGKSDTLLFVSQGEVDKLAKALKENGFSEEFSANGKKMKLEAKIQELLGKPNFAQDGSDIALFGRMVAQAATLNIEASASFSHAISTHKATNEVEFFTAIDDCDEAQGSAHMGSLEFNSATYYRYVSLDLGQLLDNLGGQDSLLAAVETFVKALFLAVPSARQTTMSGASAWDFARVYIREGQRLQASFDTPVKSGDGFLEPSKKALREFLDQKEKLFGSLFKKIKMFEFGEDGKYSVDNLVSDILDTLKSKSK